MSQHIVNSYDQELSALVNAIINMGELVKELVEIAGKSLQELDKSFIDIANITDQKINKYDSEIEHRATVLLALRQPMAIDLRQVVSALKLAVIMERMGDLAKNIAKRASKINIEISSDILEDIDQMIAIIVTMLKDVVIAFKMHDDNKALNVAERDRNVDKIYYGLMDKLINNQLKLSSNTASMMQLIFVVKNIERIGDYVTKIAKITHYIITGERLKKAF
ncbi:Phosphate transport system protein PhoU [Rickettsiales bacterium Ac37b]|nr:Phosphate transport system protein PhoU [Rickettsiales bacterium Ac37b]